MSALLWQSWPRITLLESEILYKYFQRHGSVMQFKSHRKYLQGPLGQGVVMFAEPDAADKLLESSQGAIELSSEYADSKSSRTDWPVRIRSAGKSPDFMVLEQQLHRHRSTLKRELTNANTALQVIDTAFPGVASVPAVQQAFETLRESTRAVMRK